MPGTGFRVFLSMLLISHKAKPLSGEGLITLILHVRKLRLGKVKLLIRADSTLDLNQKVQKGWKG